MTGPTVLRHALRRLRRAPGFSTAAVLTLALGLGATTTVFAVVYGVVIRPLPFDDPDQLVSLSHTLEVSGISSVDQSDATFLFYRAANRAFVAVAGYQTKAVNLGAATGTAGGGGVGESERVTAARVSASLFSVLRVAPLAGRVFDEADDRPGAAPVVLIGQPLWERKYGSAARIVGSRVEIDAVLHEVVGVMPARFRFPMPTTELWVPLRLDPGKTDSASFDYQAVARLRAGVSPEAAAADLQASLPRLPEVFPGRMTAASIEQVRLRAVVRPLRDRIVGETERVLWVVLGAVAFVLMVAAANVANLFLVRAEGRRQDLAICEALGAGRATVLKEFLGEGLIVAGFGGALGLGLALAALRALSSVGTGMGIPRLDEVRLDLAVLAGVGAGVVVAGVVVSGLPALHAGRWLSGGLGAMAGSATAARERHRARNALLVVQVALALMLVAGAGLMARSFSRLVAVSAGFDPSQALTFRVAVPDATYPDAGDAARFFGQAVDALSQLSGVRSAAAVSRLPLEEEGRTDTAVWVEDRPLAPGDLPGIHPVVYATPGYFQAAGIPLFEGGPFERPNPPRVVLEAVVSRAFAARYWPGESAIGKRIRILLTGPWYTVVGTAADVHVTALERPPDEVVYCPIVIPPEDTRWVPRDLAFVVRAVDDPGPLTEAIRTAARQVDPALPLYRVRPLRDIVTHARARTSFMLLLLGCASIVAVVLGAIGIYGVMSYVVSLRTREIGVRLALGADMHRVLRQVMGQGMAVAGVGIVVGLAGAIALARVLGALLFEVRPSDPPTLAGSAVLLFLVAAVAAWVPARRAARIDPARVLRSE